MFAVEENGRRLAVPENFTQTVIPYADGERTDYRAGGLGWVSLCGFFWGGGSLFLFKMKPCSMY